MGEEIRIRSAKGGEECVEVTSLASLILRVGVLSSWPGPESAQIFSPKKLGDPIFFWRLDWHTTIRSLYNHEQTTSTHWVCKLIALLAGTWNCPDGFRIPWTSITMAKDSREK